jgi:hypothetical protein
MNSPFSRRSLLLIVASSLMAMLTACGSSDQVAGVGTGGTGSLAKSVSGQVADGYLVNATVFLDKNVNYQLDAGEPFAVTDANGAYTLTVDAADIGKYPIVALAVKGVTLDKDSNQVIAGSYVLSMPKENVSGMVGNNFISPISTQLREMMETGKYATLPLAMAALATNLGLSAGTDVTVDFLAANNAAMHAQAQNMATLMANQMAQVLSGSGTAIIVDVNRYRGMMGTIFSNMSSLRGTNVQSSMSGMNSTMATVLSITPPTIAGQPYRNMSTSYRGMMGGVSTMIGGMK